MLHDFRDHSLILCTIPSFNDPMHQANASNSCSEPQSDYPTSRLSLAADPELPVYTSNDCTALGMGSTHAATQVHHSSSQHGCLPAPVYAGLYLPLSVILFSQHLYVHLAWLHQVLMPAKTPKPCLNYFITQRHKRYSARILTCTSQHGRKTSLRTKTCMVSSCTKPR